VSVDVANLYRQFGPLVLRRCRVLMRDEALAQDAMHDVFVELVRRREGLDVASPSSYLFRSATHICLNKLRSRRRKPLDGDDDLLSRIACAPGEETSHARILLDRIFGREPASTRAMAVMHLLDGLTLQEVAQETGLSVSGVRKRLRTLQTHVAELEGIPA